MRTRGQSSVDFVIGFGVFFLTFTFVIALLPELLSPFASPEGTVIADRVAGTLGEELLASGTVGTFNETCTEEFFQANGSSCSFNASEPTADIVGVSESHSLNVTLEQYETGGPGTAVACYNETGVVDCPDGGDRLARGGSPPTNTQSVRTARRVVRLDGESLVLRVRTW